MNTEVIVALITVVGLAIGAGGALTRYIDKRGERKPPWERAMASLEQQVEDLREDVKQARASMEAAEARADEVVAENHGLKNTIALQTRALDAKDGRIVQLLTAWPPGSRPPSPNPAHEPYL